MNGKDVQEREKSLRIKRVFYNPMPCSYLKANRPRMINEFTNNAILRAFVVYSWTVFLFKEPLNFMVDGYGDFCFSVTTFEYILSK